MSLQMPPGWDSIIKGRWRYVFGSKTMDDGSVEPYSVHVTPDGAYITHHGGEQGVVEYDLDPERYKHVLWCFAHATDDAVARYCYLAAEAIRNRCPEFIHDNPELERLAMQIAWGRKWIKPSTLVYAINADEAPAYAAMLTEAQQESTLWYWMAEGTWSLEDEEYVEDPAMVAFICAMYPDHAESIRLFAPQIHEACSGFMRRPVEAKAYVRDLVAVKPMESLELPDLGT